MTHDGHLESRMFPPHDEQRTMSVLLGVITLKITDEHSEDAR